MAERFDIQSIIKHPLYNGKGPRNDLAIVFTKKKIQFNERKQKIALADNGDGRPKRAKFSAWGHEDNKHQASEVLRESDLDVLEVFDCARPEFFNNSHVQRRLKEGSIFCAAAVVRVFDRNLYLDNLKASLFMFIFRLLTLVMVILDLPLSVPTN